MVARDIFLTLTGVVVRKRGQTILGPVDLMLGQNGTTVVMGPNGAGKTTLLKAMHGLERVSDGEVHGVEEAQDRQAYVFQNPIMLRRSVFENLAYPLRLHGCPKGEVAERVELWSGRIGLREALGRQATRLSGGEKQKLAIGRALIREPELVFLDEPSANLDGRATLEIEALLQKAASAGTRLVMTTHDLGQARRLADDVVFLHDGQVLEHRTASEFFDTPETSEAAAFLKGEIVA